MNEIRIENVKTGEITPYKNNPRFNDEAVRYVADSIREFGFKVPIVIDKNNVIVTGHTRYKAALDLGLDTVPCIRADDLTEEQIKAFRLVDNRVSEIATWDYNKLELEIANLDFDLSEFDFDFGDFGNEPDGLDDDDFGTDIDDEYVRDQSTQDRVENILNLGRAQYNGVGKYDIPPLEPVYELPPIKEWIGFNYVMSDDAPEGKAVHFFVDDYQFERIWNNPEHYVEKLRKYVCVASPDFSPYGDMPFICQVFNHYRKHWVARYFQEHGITVIPTIRCSTDPRSHSWFLDGEPEGGIVIMSSMWSKEYPAEAREEYRMMKEALKPKKVFIYGGKGDMGIDDEKDNVEYIKNFLQKRFGGV